jgi:hypothetical protein
MALSPLPLDTQDINQFLVHESGRLTYDIYERTQYSSPWTALPEKAAWPQGIGDTITNTMWERSYVQEENPWAPMNLNDGSDNSCIPPIDLVEFFTTNRTTSLYQKAVESIKFCVTDLLFVGKAEKQMELVQRGIAEQVRLTWIKWNREGFTRLANKYIVEGALTNFTTEADGLTFPPIASTSRLTNGVLDYFHNLLTIEQGAEHALAMSNGKPVYGLITDSFTSRFLIRGDDAIREDFRFADPDKLMGPLGVTHTYNGFVHMIDEAPPRYNFNAGAWVPVPHYKLTPVGPALPIQRYRKDVDPLWLQASHQDSFIYVKKAYLLRVPGSISGVAAADFDPQKYMGDYQWQNVKNLDQASPAYNPDGKLGNFRGVLASGVEAINPHVMFVLRHLVCPTDLGLVGCTVP